MPLQPGMIIDRYRILNIGSSNLLSTTYFAEETDSFEPVIIRTYFEGRETSDSFQLEFSNIAGKLTELNHPNLEKVIGFGILESGVYLVSENTDSTVFTDIIDLPVSSKEAAHWLIPAAEALHYLHTHDMVHGDLSLSNVLIDSQKRIRLTGHGLYALLTREITWSMPSSMLLLGIGSIPNKPPEQIHGREPEQWADIFALGAIFFTMLTGQNAFTAETPIESSLLRDIQPVGWPKKLKVKASSGSVRFIQRCLARKPEQRFKSAAEMIKILQRLSDGKFVWVPAGKTVMADGPKMPAYVLILVLTMLALPAAVSAGYYQFKYIPDNLATATSFSATNFALTPTKTPTSTQTPTRMPTFTPTFTITPTSTRTTTPTPKPTYHAVIGAENIYTLTEVASEDFRSKFLAGSLPEGVKINRIKEALSFSPDGKYLAVSGLAYQGFVLDGTNLTEILSIKGRISPGRPFAPDSKSILTIQQTLVNFPLSRIPDEGEYLFLNQTITRSENALMLGPYEEQNQLAFTPDGKLIIMGEATRTRVWDVKTGQPIETIDGGEYGCQVTRAKHNREFISALSSVGYLFTWDEKTQYICSLRGNYPVLSPDQHSMAYINNNGLLQVDDLTSRNMKWRELIRNASFDFSPDNGLLVVASKDSGLKIYDAQSGSVLNKITYPFGQVIYVKFSPNGKYVAVINSEYKIILFGVYSNK